MPARHHGSSPAGAPAGVHTDGIGAPAPVPEPSAPMGEASGYLEYGDDLDFLDEDDLEFAYETYNSVLANPSAYNELDDDL
jgi:hypothetical protein